jgi:ubiquinone/menaquinone biosynthesis C-methylase UbiE
MAMAKFNDQFSKQSAIYAKHRPNYPDELFVWLSAQAPSNELAWDCATGNGQAAVALATHFQDVLATDASSAQLEHAVIHPKVRYRLEEAEDCSALDESVDLITVAQAAHWFEWDTFYSEVNRVLKPGGLIAMWAYGLPSISEEIDSVVRDFHDRIVDPFWLPQNRLIEAEYRTLPFPFEEEKTPTYCIQKRLPRTELFGLLRTWSATQKYIDHHQQNPIDLIRPQIESMWDEESYFLWRWKLILKVGKK